MQTLSATSYNALNSKSRNPNARVKVKRNYDSIPFEGKTIHSTTTNEKYPQHILHSDERMCLVYSKYVTVASKYQLYFKSTNTARTVWNTAVDLISTTSHDWYEPTIVQINSSNNLGIIVNRNNTDLFSLIVNTSGVIQTAISDTTINGTHPTLTKIGTTYWLAYERSGILYYRTSADFLSWSAETNLNTITGLSNDHDNPYLYYDTSNKLWLTFERVTDAAATPTVKNIYTMISIDSGSSWASPVAQTALVAGEGSCVNSSLIDTTAYRYLAYTFEQQIQNYEYESSTYGENRYFISDDSNSRVLFIAGTAWNNYRIVMYNKTTDVYTHYLLSDHGMTSGNVTAFDYDSTNNIMVVGTTANGIITYAEDTTTWTEYTATTTPVILDNYIRSLRIKANIIYYSCIGGYPVQFGLLNLGTSTNTQLSGTLDNVTSTQLNKCYVSDNYIVFFIRYANGLGISSDYPTVRVYNKSTLVLKYSSVIGSVGTYKLLHQYEVFAGNYIYSGIAYDESNDVLYTPAQDVALSDDNGIALYAVGSSAVTFQEYWSNAIGNSYGLLPNPDIANNKRVGIMDMYYKTDYNRLYLAQQTSSNASGNYSEFFISNINTVTKLSLNYWAQVSSNDYTSLFSSIDGEIIKILLIYYHPDVGGDKAHLTADDDLNLIFHTEHSLTHKWHLLSTSSTDQKIYYRRTSDDSTWSAQATLTSDSNDNNCNLGYSDSRLKAFWHRDIDGTYEIRWDEDLSSEIDVSEYVESFTIDKTDEHNSNKATTILSDSLGLFDPLNYSSLKHDYFVENNIITIEKGNNGEYNDAFYGLIGSGESTYKRGEQIVYRLDVWDRSKNFFKKKVTTPLFEGQTVEYIANYVAANYMGLAAGEYNTLPAITNIIPTVQFINEYVMDILFKIYQPYNYFPWFDESGNLKAKEYNYNASTDFTYYQDGTDTPAANKVPAMNIIGFDYEWTDKELVNQVVVIGETEATTETTFPEEFLGFLQGVAGWFSKSTNFTFWFSTDKTLYCEEPRLDVTDSCGNDFFGGGESMSAAGGGKQLYCTVNQTVSNLIAVLYTLIAAALAQWMLYGVGVGNVAVINPLAGVLGMALTILGQIGNYYYEIYGRPVGDALPDTIEATADDTDLQDKYGVISMEIDNPFLDTYAKCINLAENELEKAKWFRYIPTLRICANQAHQIGDVILAYNDHTGENYKIFATDVSNEYKRGEADVDVIRGGLII